VRRYVRVTSHDHRTGFKKKLAFATRFVTVMNHVGKKRVRENRFALFDRSVVAGPVAFGSAKLGGVEKME